MSCPPPKKQKVQQKFIEEYSKIWDFIKASHKGVEYAHCSICDCEVKISSGARSDLERHIKTPKHVKCTNAKASMPSISSMFATKLSDETSRSSFDSKVMKAEMLFSTFLVEQNLPIAIADHTGNLFHQMFPDSEIAKSFTCDRTKSRQLIKTMGEDFKCGVVEKLKKRPFSLSTVDSNDKGAEQIYPIMVRYHDDEKVVTDVLAVATPKGSSTGENIFNALDEEIQRLDLSWQNCISFGSDNAAVMLGSENGVAAFISRQNPQIHIQGCPCHLLHIAAKRGAANLRCKIEEALIDIFHYLENSTKRMKSLQPFQVETGTAMRKIIKHGPTRWLSLLRCVERLEQQWEALEAFFAKEKEVNKDKATDRLSRIIAFFNNKASKAYVLLLQFALPIYINANLMLQREEPVIHLLQKRLHDVVTDILIAFIKPEAITKTANIYEIEHLRRSRQKDREEIMIGEGTRKYLQLKTISGSEVSCFFEDVRKFFSSSLHYIFNNLPLKADSLTHAEVLDINLRTKVKFSSVRFWAHRFHGLILNNDLERLEKEFGKFQLDSLIDLDLSTRVDVLWSKIAAIKDDSTSQLKYESLAYFMKGLCVIPHSNADSERVFSLMRKNKTEARASISRDLLSDILLLKAKMVSRGECCYSYKPSATLLSKAKSGK